MDCLKSLIVILALLLVHLLGSVCQSTSKCTITRRGNLYCCDVFCPKGSQPVCANDSNELSLDCEPCPSGSFAPGPTHPHMRCKLRKRCIGPGMIYTSHGDAETNAICDCETGYDYQPTTETCHQSKVIPPAMTTTNVSPSVSPSSAASTGGIGLYGIIAIVGGVFIVFIVILVIMFFRRCCKRPSSYQPAHHEEL